MARIGVLCLVASWTARAASAEAADPLPYAAWQSNAPHAPPPAIVLGAPPAPELPAAEYARRPFELIPELVLGFASCAEGSANDARCSGLSAGLGLAGTLLWRVSPYFAFGGTLAGVQFGFRPAPATGLRQTSANGVFYGLLARVYGADHGLVEPYLELGLGAGSVETNAREPDDALHDETAGGRALRLGGGIELFLSRHLRVGPAFDWTRLDVGHVRRCSAAQCVELDPASYGHGTGFSSVSLRLSLLLGPGL